jgi:hypothetical protein
MMSRVRSRPGDLVDILWPSCKGVYRLEVICIIGKAPSVIVLLRNFKELLSNVGEFASIGDFERAVRAMCRMRRIYLIGLQLR